MKTKTLLLAILTFVFTATGQITPDIMPGDDDHAAAFSPNGEYVVTVADGNIGGIVPYGDGLLRVYHRNGDNTFTMVTEYIVPQGTTSSAGVAIWSKSVAVSNTGDYCIYFQDDIISENPHTRLVKNGIEMDSFTESGGMGINTMSIKDGALYICGQTISGTYFKKYDMATNNLLWSINPGGDTPRIVKTAGFNPHLKMFNGDLVEFDDATGANLGIIATGISIDKINQYGELERYIGGTMPTLIFPNAEMDWGVYNFWAQGGVTYWHSANGKTFGLSGGYLKTMSDKLVHGFTNNPLVPASAGVDLYLDSHIFDDGSVTLITYIEGGGSVDDIIDIRHFDYVDNVPVPTLNSSAADVVSVHDGQRYIDGSWTDTYERIGTIVLNGSSMPNVDDIIPFDWVNPVTGYTMVQEGDVAPHVEIDSDNNLFVRFVFYENGATTNLNNLRVYLKSSSTVSVGENNLDIISGYFNNSSQSFVIRSQEQIIQGAIYDINGRKTVLFSDNNDIYVGNLSTGVYIVKAITDTGKIFNKKFIKH